ncbi:HET-domain-containing protein [Lentinus tigrinus ALCF2SS1-7]|uniref:HET-domain-containing protein n=1 Tax=Lentinus tigrinus ALCF2SS1-7 TaxID=1328758 RepID=UPI001165FB21|nr:HET-domain-containing protein [Lentinus tigrinus ALCF2SS1-7]
MWLLNTARATLTYFPGPEDVPGGYAILSHVWRENEQSFKDLQALREACALTGQNPRDRASDKIRVFCELAETHGYQWVWVDSCCIDKSSSSELSEAINSMYRYYTLAEVCYAYLFDVPTGDVKDRCSRAWTFFKESKWHTRGWTLQELLAPNTVLLLSRDWATLGTKATLSQDLWLATKIPEDVLQRRRSIGEYSIAQRMSWAARRQTTRLEDEAYCLMGIFDINMPTLYGEGRKAFHRLQGEIMKKSIDTSLFAWGITDTTNTRFALDAPTSSLQCKRHHFRFAHAFAQSPYDFLDCTDVCFVSPPELRSRVSYLRGNVVIERLPAFTDTPHGVLASIIVFDVDGTLYALLSYVATQQTPHVRHTTRSGELCRVPSCVELGMQLGKTSSSRTALSILPIPN